MDRRLSLPSCRACSAHLPSFARLRALLPSKTGFAAPHHFSTLAGKGKFLVVLNHTWPPPDGLVAYAFTTTNVDHFAAARVPEESIVRLNPGDYPFVTAATVIDLTRPEREQLSAVVAAPSFRFVVQLRAEHVKAIDEAVRASTRIERRVKKMILASYG